VRGGRVRRRGLKNFMLPERMSVLVEHNESLKVEEGM
jgi:hypothetical protein